MANKKPFNIGGQKGKLHDELGIPEGQKIPAKRLAQAENSKNPAVKRDAIRAKTMEGFNHTGPKGGAKSAPPKAFPPKASPKNGSEGGFDVHDSMKPHMTDKKC